MLADADDLGHARAPAREEIRRRAATERGFVACFFLLFVLRVLSLTPSPRTFLHIDQEPSSMADGVQPSACSYPSPFFVPLLCVPDYLFPSRPRFTATPATTILAQTLPGTSTTSLGTQSASGSSRSGPRRGTRLGMRGGEFARDVDVPPSPFFSLQP